jgi:hypothetical protein
VTPGVLSQYLLGWKPSSKNKAGWSWVPNVADVDNVESLTLAARMLDNLGIQNPNTGAPPTHNPPANPGSHLEDLVRSMLDANLPSSTLLASGRSVAARSSPTTPNTPT